MSFSDYPCHPHPPPFPLFRFTAAVSALAIFTQGNVASQNLQSAYVLLLTTFGSVNQLEWGNFCLIFTLCSKALKQPA